MGRVILCNLSDAEEVISEERVFWINEVLDALGIPDEAYDVNTIDDFRYNMDQYGIEVELGTSGNVNVYRRAWHEDEIGNSGWLPVNDDHLVAQWKAPERAMKVDDKGAYYEIHLNEWSSAKKRKK